jgi:AcrR family transcriptional regulator
MEETRKKIIDAATEVFSEYGFFRAPTHLVAMRAGVSKGLIFWYFKDKDELILEVARKALPAEVISSCLEKDIAGKDLLRCIAESYISKYTDPKMRNLLLHSLSASSHYEPLAELLKKTCGELLQKATLKVFGELNPKNIVKMRVLLGALMCYSINKPTELSENEYIDEVLSLVYESSNK